MLDSVLRRESVVDVFESLIWNEKYNSYGDFELEMHYTPAAKKMLAAGKWLAHNESQRVMVIENSEKKNDDEGRAILTVTGRSLETILEDRVVSNGMVSTTTSPKWVMSGAPGALARTLVKRICEDGLVNVSDIIPFLQPGSLTPGGNIPLPSASITIEQPLASLYAVVQSLCDIYDMGFRLLRDLDTSKLYFEIYMGNDRTTRQTLLNPVIFSPDLDNLTDVKELSSIAQYKNVCYVFSKNGTAIAYAIGADSSTKGFERRVMYVDASSDITLPAGAALQAALIKRGEDELAANRALFAFDGEISQQGGYRYGKHYNLGDLVEMRTDDGATNIMRVSEQIFVSDSQGDRSYPTLSINSFITPGTWEAAGALVWNDATGTWVEAA